MQYPLCVSDFNETWILSTLLEKYTNMKFHKHPTIRSRIVPCGRTDRHDESNSRFSKFFESAKKIVFFFAAEVMFTLSRNINVTINIILSFLKSWQFMKFLGVTLDSGCGLQWKRTKSLGVCFYKKGIPTIRLNLFCVLKFLSPTNAFVGDKNLSVIKMHGTTIKKLSTPNKQNCVTTTKIPS